jgi:hypothetical protein
MQNPGPPDSDRTIAANSLPVSPREAAMRALVYRRGLREKPRDSLIRVAAWVGTILLHIVFLFAIILGPAYDMLPPPPDKDSLDALQVRLMDKPPPPLPPVRGTPSKAPVAKTKKAASQATASRASRGAHAAAVASATKALPAIAVPAAEPPKVKPDVTLAAPPPSVAAVIERPLVPPKAPPAQPELEKVPVPTQAPPDLAVDSPKPEVVPPRFQPEPVRKVQAEGLAPMPPPASLAIPPTPASQMAVTPTPPTITSERTAPVPTTAMTLATVPRPDVETSSAPPTLQDAPLPNVAQEATAPKPDLTVDTRPVPPKVSAEPVRAPSVDATADLEAVPLPDAAAKPTVSAPVAPSDRPAVQAPAIVPGELQRPVAGIDTSPAPPGEAPGDTSAGESTAPTHAADGKATNDRSTASAQGNPGSPSASGQTSAENAGSNAPGAEATSGKPGSAKGVENSDRVAGANGTSQRDDGVVGGEGDKKGQVGAYTELKPRGNVTVQNGARVHIDYKATRFDNDWTPKGESTVDTAIRHGVEKSTVHFAVPLPRGVRINCVAGPGDTGGGMHAISIFTLGCGGDPPPKPANADATAKNQTMAPARPLAENLPPANAATVAAAPVALDNTAYCATARVAGGPLPPGCEASIKINLTAPNAASGSWVPASDQFK